MHRLLLEVLLTYISHVPSTHNSLRYKGTTVLLSVFTNYGRPELEEAQLITIRLQQNCDIIDIGEITFTENVKPKQRKGK